jgi:hypothetical protein
LVFLPAKGLGYQVSSLKARQRLKKKVKVTVRAFYFQLIKKQNRSKNQKEKNNLNI